MNIRPFEERDRDALIRLWKESGLVSPTNDPDRDIDLKLAQQPDLFFVGEVDGAIVATVMAGYEGHRGWINYLATGPNHRRMGFGREIMSFAEDRLAELGCPKVNLQVRGGNSQVVEFYESIGYSVEDRISLGKRIDA